MINDDIDAGAPVTQLSVTGISHQKTPLEVREQFALTSEEAAALESQLIGTESIEECVIINTCNRVEIYTWSKHPIAAAEVRRFFQDYKELSATVVGANFYRYDGLEAIQHLFSVAAGLDSQMVGETDILGQLKQAHAGAQTSASIGDRLNRLLQKSFQAAKEVRTQTKITRGQVSVGSVTVDLANRIFGKLSSSRVLLLGSGEVSEKTAQSLKSRGVNDISVSGRTFEKAHQIARELHGATIEFSDVENHLHHFDILIGSTAATFPLITLPVMKRIMSKRPERPYFVIDLALPRDVDPAVETIENVYLYNLDDLSKIANENLAARRSEMDEARAIIERNAWNLWLQLRRRELTKPLRQQTAR